MNLTTLINGVYPYLEYGWVTAPNTARQSITGNTITTLTIDTEVADTGNFGSVASNQITLAAGTYYFEGHTVASGIGNRGIILSLFNVTDSSYISRIAYNISDYLIPAAVVLKGQFSTAGTKVFDLRFVATADSSVGSGGYNNAFTLATAGADQRTTIKLWKLA